MKLMFVFVPTDCLEACHDFFDEADVHAYTEIPNVLGSGEAGRKLGTRAYPGTSTLVLLALPKLRAEEFLRKMEGFCSKEKRRSETRVFAVDADRVF